MIIKNIKELLEAVKTPINQLNKPCLVLLQGQLGAGKTTLVKSYCEFLGINPNSVKSPTFSLVNIYRSPNLNVNHLDLYRLNDDLLIHQELLELTSTPSSITFVEWPERIDFSQLPNVPTLLIEITRIGEESRELSITNTICQ